MTTVEVERSGEFEEIPFSDFSIETGTSDVRLAPEATVTTSNNVAIQPNQRLRITIDGTTRFEGTTISGGSRRGDGRRRVQAEHDAFRIFNEAVSVSGSTDAATILSDALAETSFGSFTLDYTGTSETLAETYDADGRKVKQIFRDIADRTNRVFWVDAVANTITVQPRGGRGEFASVTLPGDPASVQEYENGSVRSVENDVTVVGTGEERVEGRATDSTSISEYGRRSEQFNVAYVTTEAEAENAAAELLSPEPLDSAKVLLGSSIGTNPDQTLANHQLRVTDPSVGLDDDVFVIQSQKIEQGRVEVDIGEAATSGIDSINRDQKSNRDTADVGSIIGETSIADGSIVESKLDALSVSVDKIQDAAVDEAKVRQDAISETKVQDDSISTPKLQVGSVTAGTIDTAAVTATAIDADAVEAGKIDADAVGAREIIAASITASEIDSNTITASEIDTLFLETGQFEVSGPGGDFEVNSKFNDFLGDTVTLEFSGFGTIGHLGADGPDIIYCGSVEAADGIEVTDDGTTDTVLIEEENGNIRVQPDGDVVGNVGSFENAWSTMRAGSFIEDSPDPADQETARLDELLEVDWYAPPRYVDADQRRRDTPADDHGVELGHMTNYLLEVCKEQQQTIDDQADRIDDLEARLETLEAEVGVGPNA